MSIRSGARARLERVAAMDRRTLVERIAARLAHAFGYRPNVRRIAYRLDRYSRRLYDSAYAERDEVGPVNLEVKLERQRLGGPFEPPIVALVNAAVISLLQPGQRRILEVGSGTGMFAWSAAGDVSRAIVASEFDEPTRRWAIEHRSRPNITYCARPLDSFAAREFDLVVAIEVIEHIGSFGPFLRDLSRVADNAIVSTPNKHSSAFRSVARTPPYSEHVREWTAGEFLWVLRAFYARVDLYTVPDLAAQVCALERNPGYVPMVAGCSDLSCEEPLLAACAGSLLA